MNIKNMTVLLVDDEEEILLNYGMFLRYEGIGSVMTLNNSKHVMQTISDNNISVIVLDLIMPHMSGKELLPLIKREYPDIPVIVMTAVQEIESAVECMKNGAFDYLVKPVEKDRFVSSVRNAVEVRGLREELTNLRHHFLSDTIENKTAFSKIITSSSKMEAIFRYTEAIAKTPAPVCIVGETGVGKELLAQALYSLSSLKGKFIAVNVGGLDDTMFSDTLFGHKKGAFSGADQDRDGLIMQASEGMLLLDEIGDLSEASQVKLLRVLEDHKYYPLGSDIPVQCNTRIIASTNKDLDKMIQDGLFRKDLYFRICGHLIHIPPLRERQEDIPLLFEYFLKDSCGGQLPSYSSEIIPMLINYDFPGNVRELQAIVNDAIARCRNDTITKDVFGEYLDKRGAQIKGERTRKNLPFPEITSQLPTLKEMEDLMIDEAMKRANNRQAVAASLLGISRQALNRRLLNRSRKS